MVTTRSRGSRVGASISELSAPAMTRVWQTPPQPDRPRRGRRAAVSTPGKRRAPPPDRPMRKWTYRLGLSARFGPILRPNRPNRYVELRTVDGDGLRVPQAGERSEHHRRAPTPRTAKWLGQPMRVVSSWCDGMDPKGS